MAKRIALLLFLTLPLLAQPPDVTRGPILFTGVASDTPIFVGASGPIGWRLTYYVDGTLFTAAQVAIQGADATSAATCATATFASIATANADVLESLNPSVSGPQGNVGAKSYYPCIRMRVTAITGSGGSVIATLSGYRNTFIFPIPVTVTPGGTQNVNVIQYGSVATSLGQKAMAASMPVVIASDQSAISVTIPANSSVNLNQVGGVAVTLGQKAMAASIPVVLPSDQAAIPVTPAANSSVNINQIAGTPVLNGGVAGSQGVGGLAASGAAASGNPIPVGGTDGAGNAQTVKTDTNGDQLVVNSCILFAAFNLSGSGDTQIVALSAAKKIVVCSILFSTTVPEDVKFTEGTGSNCATGNTTASGLYKSITAFAHDAMGMLYTTTAGDALCLNQANAQALGGTVWYRYQ